MDVQPGFIVQDRESGYFLYPDDGAVGYTKWLKEAGVFDDAEEAITTADDACSHHGYDVFAFFRKA
jgi:S-adenosylmethionine hydrolase